MSLDPASLQVLLSRLTGVAEEMGAVLRRSAFSPNIRERADCSAALFAPDGELLVQAEHIPVHLGSMPASVQAAIAAFPGGVGPGEQVLLNDPFAGGTHLNDLTLVAPCYVGTTLVGWVANRAHHADVGGMVAGSLPPAADEIYQEGLRIPPVRLSPDIVAVLCANSRTADERRGDLDAQIGANVVGISRMADVAGSPGGLAVDEVAAYGERRMRAAIAALPDGTWQFADVIDSTGSLPSQRRPARIVATLTIAGETVTFDFTGSDAQRAGNTNAVEAVTISVAAFALRSVTDPTIPAGGGALRPLRVIAPAGSVVAASPPAAVGAGNVEVSQRLADVCLGALAAAVPDRVAAAGQGTMNNLILGGPGWVYYETIGGGQGGRPGQPGTHGKPGRPGKPGQSGIHTGMTNTRDTPIEALERAYPLRVTRYRLRRGSGGAGRYPGGEGIEREIEVLVASTLTLITERRTSSPYGLAGGEAGAVGENWLIPAGDASRAVRIPDKVSMDLAPGDRVRVLTPGGGGWGAAAGSAGSSGSAGPPGG